MLKGLQVEIGLWLPLPHSKWSTGYVSHTLSLHFQWAHTIPPLSPLSSPTLDPGSRHFLCLDCSSPKYLYVCSFTSFWSLLKYQLLRESFSGQLLQTYSSQPIRSPIPDLTFPYSTYRHLMFILYLISCLAPSATVSALPEGQGFLCCSVLSAWYSIWHVVGAQQTAVIVICFPTQHPWLAIIRGWIGRAIVKWRNGEER